MISLKEFTYSDDSIRLMEYWNYAHNWPVVYIMHNDKDAYVGETLDAVRRTKQHLEEKVDTQYKIINIMTDKDFNKSVILDLESFLIKYMSADGKFTLHNGNAGIVDHNYFNRDIYQDSFRYAWMKLMENGLAQHTIDEIENSDLYKYSPYKALTPDQDEALIKILRTIQDRFKYKDSLHKKNLIVVNGCAGTGKTILAVYLVKILKEISDGELTAYQFEDDIEDLSYLSDFAKRIGKLKIGFVVPMQSLRESLKKVFSSIDGLSADMILKPTDVAGDYYDLLVVDEAHRLHRRAYLAQYPAFDKVNKQLGYDENGTELDWIISRSSVQLIFYDNEQSVRPSDIDREKFLRIIDRCECEHIELNSQLRCKGGNDYIEYVKDVLYERANRRMSFANYDLRFYDDANQMIQDIRDKDRELGLCRTVAGYAWKWKSRDDKQAADMTFDDQGYQWNSTATDWISSPNSVNEIGCIHTVQGYDLNIAGVIFGPEIKYNTLLDTIEIDKANYHDNLGKTKDMNDLKAYITNIYVTLMTRGISGTYVYVCDPDLREYLRRYF